MTIKKIIIICSLIIIVLNGLTACGNNSDIYASAMATNNQETSVKNSLPAVDPDSSVDNLIGNWVDIKEEDRFAVISEKNNTFSYEDNEGKYSAEFIKGVLKVYVSPDAVADVFFNAKNGHMYAVYQGEWAEFKKK